MKRRALFVAVLLAVMVLLAAPVLRHLGNWLMVDDPLNASTAIVVFGGHLPFRAMAAAEIYHQGWAPQIWLTRGGVWPEDIALQQLGIERVTEEAYNRQVLERLGVPANAIRLLDGRTQNTAEEVHVVANALQATGGNRVILITSKYHTRRVEVLWQALVGNRQEAIVRYTASDPFDPNRWWRNTGDAMAVSREYFGLLNAWAGFPVKSERW